MNRPTGVTVVAVLSLIGSALLVLMSIMMAAVMAFVPVPEEMEAPMSPVFFKVLFLLAALLFFLPALWGIISGIGLYRMKNWARISTISFAVLLIFTSGFQLLMSFFMAAPPGATDPMSESVMIAMRLLMAAFSLLLLGIGIWWLVYLTRPKVVQQFQPVSPPATEEASRSMQDPAGPPSVMGSSRRPASITIIAWFLLSSCLLIPLIFVMHAPAILFTEILIGRPAVLVYLIHLAVLLYCGIGLLRLKPAARLTTIGYFIFGIVNVAIFFGAPGGGARFRTLMDMQRSLIPWMPTIQDPSLIQFNPMPLVISGIIGNLALFAVLLYFLISNKKSFVPETEEPKG
jgi:hypothetical protein